LGTPFLAKLRFAKGKQIVVKHQQGIAQAELGAKLHSQAGAWEREENAILPPDVLSAPLQEAVNL